MSVLCQTCAASQQIHLGAGAALRAPRGTTGDRARAEGPEAERDKRKSGSWKERK